MAKTSRPSFWINYKPGKKDIHGNIIEIIYTLTNDVVIYGTVGEGLTWSYDGVECPNADKALSLAQALLTRVDAQLPKRKIEVGKRLIYASLGLAIESKVGEPIEPFFQEAQIYIESIMSESLHLRFVGTAIMSTVIFVLPVITYYFLIGRDNIYQFLAGIALGGCGALVSLLQRFNSIHIPKYSSWRFIIVRAFSRVLLGVIFAAILIIFQKAGLVLSTFGNSSLLIYSFAFISGFSERFVPELIDQLQKSSSSDSRILQ